ncbi:3-methyl-2-oxobutanoate hydroxymethyltransferase [bacterium HR19]|nr:3-methyl-2-oxobutanoate hydroxymethyltransferase [bacterium HR19]
MRTAQEIVNLKGKKKIICLTSYSYLFAKIVDETGLVDVILVGDSMNEVWFGERNTTTIPLDVMIWCARSVRKAVKNAMVVFDMPFGTFWSKEVALKNVVKIVKEADPDAVKIEGGKDVSEIIREIVKIGVPVMGHIGLLPQRARITGYKKQGKEEESAKRIFEDALSVEESGAFSVVLESVETELAKKITQSLKIPTIGIASGPYCDGKIAVLEDIVGLTQPPPKHVKPYDNLAEKIYNAVVKYAENQE